MKQLFGLVGLGYAAAWTTALCADPLVLNRLEASGSPATGYTITIPGATKGTAADAFHIDPGYLPALFGDISCPAGSGRCSVLSIDLRDVGAGPQRGVGQLGRITATYPAAMLSTKRDAFRVQLGDCPPSLEFDHEPTGTPNAASAAITGCISTPPGRYSGNSTWPDIGIAGIANAGNASKSTVAMMGYAGVSVKGGFAEAWNGVLANAPPGTREIDGAGFDFAHLYGVENDINIRFGSAIAATKTTAASKGAAVAVASTAGIAVGQAVDDGKPRGRSGVPGSPVTTVKRIDGRMLTLSQPVDVPRGATLTFRAALTGDVAGFSSYYSGETNTLGNSISFWTRGSATAHWNFVNVSDNGAADVFALVGAQGMAGPANSQQILLKCVGGTGAIGAGGSDQVCGTIRGIADGTLHLAAPGGVVIDASIKSDAPPSQFWTHDASPSAVTVAAGGTLALPPGSGMVVLREDNRGNECIFLAGVGATMLVSQLQSSCANAPAAGKLSLAYSSSVNNGAGGYVIANNLGAADLIAVSSTRLSAKN
ncbi:protein of unknown function [Beijerinckiaceae bacterium RH AL1]|nr:hypothetical protein [Beijerinckiaceae bacterium]VVB46742.1 protein of unknown function [Beijerinckiaceae bacterium RH CH11]VVB46825.1 protein of unknown function [Beijerinckiaceae bacterium RH AL8]VVC55535.1 protein of unknown function [Beijerinckiaceae bacterium RH AL1]